MALDVSGLWRFSDPALSESNFREAMKTASKEDVLILQTQIARSYGLRTDFLKAREILASIKQQVEQGSPEAHVRYLLELGRTYASATHPTEAQTDENKRSARTLFMQAFDKASDARLDYLAIDALHMMPFADSDPQAQLTWDLKAVEYMEASTQADAKKWEGSLRNNVGYAKHLLGLYDEALVQFRLSLAAHERGGNADNIRIAHWMIAWTLRAQEKYQAAIDIQLRLEQEWDEAGNPDPYVFEELELLYRAIGDEKKAEKYAARKNASS